jgi:hypothetical protein
MSVHMNESIRASLDELEQAQRSLVGTRERSEALPRLRQAVDRARRVLNNLPPLQGRGDPARHAMRQLVAAIELGEGSLRGRESAA